MEALLHGVLGWCQGDQEAGLRVAAEVHLIMIS